MEGSVPGKVTIARTPVPSCDAVRWDQWLDAFGGLLQGNCASLG